MWWGGCLCGLFCSWDLCFGVGCRLDLITGGCFSSSCCLTYLQHPYLMWYEFVYFSTISLPFACDVIPFADCDISFAYTSYHLLDIVLIIFLHFLTISLHWLSNIHAFLSSLRHSSYYFLIFPHHFFTISLPFATIAELTRKCEGNHFGVAGVCIPFPYLVLTMSLPFAYLVLHVQN